MIIGLAIIFLALVVFGIVLAAQALRIGAELRFWREQMRTDREIAKARQEIRAEIRDRHQELRNEINAVRGEVRNEINAVRGEVRDVRIRSAAAAAVPVRRGLAS